MRSSNIASMSLVELHRRNVQATLAAFSVGLASARTCTTADGFFVDAGVGKVSGFCTAAVPNQEVDARRFCDQAEEFSAQQRTPIVVWCTGEPDAGVRAECVRRGWNAAPSFPAMALTARPVVNPDARVRDLGPRNSADAHTVHTYQFPDDHSPTFFARPELFCRQPGNDHDSRGETPVTSPPRAGILGAAGYVDEQPVATAILTLTSDVAGLYWVYTRDEYRGSGLAASICRRLCAQAFDAGARLVVLQATDLSRRVYDKIGFTQFSAVERFVCLPS